VSTKRDTSRTPKKGTAWVSCFLDSLRTLPNVQRACREAEVTRSVAYRHREQVKSFAEQWDKALAEGVEAAEAEAWRRAMEGNDKPVFYLGGECGRIREYSDTLLIFMLKAHKRTVYGDKAVTVDQLRDYAGRMAGVVLTYVPEDKRDACKRDILGLPLLG
jgi:hypothetical protein